MDRENFSFVYFFGRCLRLLWAPLSPICNLFIIINNKVAHALLSVNASIYIVIVQATYKNIIVTDLFSSDLKVWRA